mmetsp:Transcript_167455/g.537751  ORF Transcript_167455/g.537751 Transcript_167455/m.537751 type:complete len:280 (+) Transcript_167455:587-1426(+)
MSNSSLSNSPLPSASPSSKQCRKKSMNALCFAAWSLRSASFRSEVASIMLFEATAVSTEIMVQDTKTMKATKKSFIEGLAAMTGPATEIQLSCVVTLKRENREVRTSQKRPLMALRMCSSNCPSPSSRNSAWPKRWVQTIADTRISRKIIEKMSMKVLPMPIKALKNTDSRGTILNTRNILTTRWSLRSCTKVPVRPTIWMKESMRPNPTRVQSRITQHLSLVLPSKNSEPWKEIRNANSAAKRATKKWLRRCQCGQSGSSVCNTNSTMLAMMQHPTTA